MNTDVGVAQNRSLDSFGRRKPGSVCLAEVHESFPATARLSVPYRVVI